VRRNSLAAVLAGAGVLVFLTALGASGAQGSQPDGSGDTFGAPGGSLGAVMIDLTAVGHTDDSTSIGYSFDTAGAITGDNLDHVQWDLDLNSNGTFGEPADACIILTSSGGTSGSAALKHGCGNFIDGTSNATISGTHIAFSFDLAFFRSKTGFNGSSYKYRVTSVDANNNEDIVPNAAGTPSTFSGSVTHTLGGSAATTPPTTTAPTTTAPTTTAPTTTAPIETTPATTAPGATTGGSTSSGTGGTSTTSDPTPTPTGNLPQTGANILYLLLGAGAFLYAGIELLGANARLDRDEHDH